MTLTRSIVAAFAASLHTALAQSASPSCSASLTARYAAPSVAPGYTAVLVAQNLTRPRGIIFDPDGHLLVVESGLGVTAYNITGEGNCLTASPRTVVIRDSSLNHGIEIASNSSSTWLYVSNYDNLYRWAYNPATASNITTPQTLVTNMSGEDHTTRTLLLSKNVPGRIVISRGSISNLDYESSDINSGHSQVKAFSIDDSESYPQDYLNDGILLGWGLRNEVGIAEHPGTGDIWGVENSADQITRDGVDVHENNPGEELNYLGNLSNATNDGAESRNYGYPECFAAWVPSDLPNFNGTVGQQFTIGTTNSTNNDALCAQRVAPRLTFQAHMAPLDILFNPNGDVAWITFHGSWNRDTPIGYKLSMVEFDATSGQPVEPSTSNSSLIDVMTNPDNEACPTGCFRPVGLAWDSQGRLFMTSDSTGEIYAIVRDTDSNGTSTAGSNTSSTTGIPSTTSGATTASTTGAAVSVSVSTSMLAIVFVALALLL